jgi:hypothetical protein
MTMRDAFDGKLDAAYPSLGKIAVSAQIVLQRQRPPT